jgi:tetrahydromethanopterin S-methyltransferase subunit B
MTRRPTVDPVEDRVDRLEKLVEVLRQELISQNKKIMRLTTFVDDLRQITPPES